ncbi:YidH family protein [Aspergillus stella-maris]|uniref:YidH family protein n=1 Tax=Aspergillus stella-maris TaxID=1810926 RepID=UPI003CCD6BC9
MASLFRRLLPKPVANNGSQLRDHQANERTFLSWTRMGLAFAAMGLAVGRLGLIEQFFNNTHHVQQNQLQRNQQESESESESISESKSAPTPTIKTTPDILASRFCQVISIWSFGYGLARYLTVRRNLGRGVFVPAFWGPVFMTAGTLGVVGVLARDDWKKLGNTKGGTGKDKEQGVAERVVQIVRGEKQ